MTARRPLAPPALILAAGACAPPETPAAIQGAPIFGRDRLQAERFQQAARIGDAYGPQGRTQDVPSLPAGNRATRIIPTACTPAGL